jgi:GH3 auxin-responsive promoter
MKPAEVQQQQLLRLVRQAAATNFGRDHEFDSVRTVADFQSRVPLRTYEQFWNEYWGSVYPNLIDCTWPGRVPFFPVSSGTTSGVTKYIPCTDAMIASNAGRSFMLGGSTDLTEVSSGVYSGDLSGIAVKTLPWWAKARYFPPVELALLKNWEEKIAVLSEHSLSADIRMISGVPSWMLIFFERLRQNARHEKFRISDAYPNLEMVVHGGVNFAPYREQFEQLLDGSHAELREVYPASEGFIAIADQGSGEGLRMNLDIGLFFEGSANPTRHWLENVEPGVNYALVMTTCAGLWSYVIGDTIRFLERGSPRILITGRTSYYLSAFGEHVIAEELEDSLATAAASSKVTINDFVVIPVFPKNSGELGGHRYYVEFASELPVAHRDFLQVFAAGIDKRLCQRNEDYEAHRAGGFGMRAPEIVALRSGTFAQWMKQRGKLGGQNKVPRIITR